MVTLVISGALFSGCGEKPRIGAAGDWGDGNAQAVTNNTYVPGRGYYHAPYARWYPHPYNSYFPGLGYYHGGNYTPSPNSSRVTASHPSGSSSHSSGISRGGFGSSGHSAS
jgi:hypothetical protein